MIPKIIHFCWLSDHPYPKEIQEYMDSWKRNLPDYEFVHWNFESFPKGKSKWVDQAFEAKKYAYAADYIRLYAVYHYGGIYLDTDVEVLKSFDPLLELPYFVGTEGDLFIEAAVIGAEKNNEWIGYCLKYFENRDFIKPNGDYDMVTLPRVMKNVLSGNYEFALLNGSERITPELFADSNKICLFPKDFFCAKEMGTGEILKTPDTFTIHHFAMSWIPGKQKIIPNIKRKLMKLFGYRRIQKIINIFGLKKIKDFW